MSLWQSDVWASMLQKTQQTTKSIMLENIFIQKRSLGLGQYGLFVMGKSTFTKTEQESLIQICKDEGVLFLQIETLDYSDISISPRGEENQEGKLSQNNNFAPGHYKKFITPYTAIIDLQQTEEEILTQMKPKGRYNIRLAAKKGVTVERVEKNEKNIKAYFKLSKETTTRDNFSGHSLQYYTDFLQSLKVSELFLASKDGEIIAGGIFVFDAEVSYYYYGASTSKKEFRNLMAPYLLQWTAIQHAKSLNSKLYDFLGVSGEGEFYDASLSGVTDFKKKLTPDMRNVSKSYIFVNQTLKYKIFLILKKLKNIIA